jgi:hypothetical protein
MKFQHALVLSCIGWYLMVPPQGVRWKLDGTGPFLPLNPWVQWGSFDTAAQCEEEKLTEMRRESVQESREPSKNPLNEPAFWYAKCIASDDPRLKEK